MHDVVASRDHVAAALAAWFDTQGADCSSEMYQVVEKHISIRIFLTIKVFTDMHPWQIHIDLCWWEQSGSPRLFPGKRSDQHSYLLISGSRYSGSSGLPGTCRMTNKDHVRYTATQRIASVAPDLVKAQCCNRKVPNL